MGEMETIKIEPVKLADMVMCGDHPSITKTELNIKEDRVDEKPSEKERATDKTPVSYARISPASSRTERTSIENRTRAISEHALRAMEARRRGRSLELTRHDDIAAPGNRALVQAALGSARWPPYLVAAWVLALLLAHALHGLVGGLQRALPPLRKFCQYFHTWTEECWKGETEYNSRLYPLALAALTGVLYALYYGLYAAYGVALWAVEPLCSDEDKRNDVETKVTNYLEEVNSKTNSNVKQ